MAAVVDDLGALEHADRVDEHLLGVHRLVIMSKLALTLACWNYDRTRALVDGRVHAEGLDLTILELPVEETFFRMLRHREFDVAEMSLSSYVLSLFTARAPLHRDSGLPLARLSTFGDLHPRRERHPRAEGSDWHGRSATLNIN